MSRYSTYSLLHFCPHKVSNMCHSDMSRILQYSGSLLLLRTTNIPFSWGPLLTPLSVCKPSFTLFLNVPSPPHWHQYPGVFPPPPSRLAVPQCKFVPVQSAWNRSLGSHWDCLGKAFYISFLVVQYVHDYVCLPSSQLLAAACVETMSRVGSRRSNGRSQKNIPAFFLCRTYVCPLRLFLDKP